MALAPARMAMAMAANHVALGLKMWPTPKNSEVIANAAQLPPSFSMARNSRPRNSASSVKPLISAIAAQ